MTSSYLEGTQNVFGAFGYNRDGKRGKKQIVIGLLCDHEGWPLSVEVFPGNTQDTATMASQIRKAAKRFGCEDVTFVGDRGMIKSKQITDLVEHKFHYITAITKPQIETLLKENIIQLGLFDTELSEVIEGNVRYILRKNPIRTQEIDNSRNSKYSAIEKLITEQNQYLSEHPKAKVDTARNKIIGRTKKLKIDKWIVVETIGSSLVLQIDKEALGEESKLDGCYIIFVRKEESTRAHAFVVMLSYCIVRFLKKAWSNIDITVQEGIDTLNQLCLNDVLVRGNYAFTSIPNPRKDIQELLKSCNVTLPKVIRLEQSTVSTKVKLDEQRQLYNN